VLRLVMRQPGSTLALPRDGADALGKAEGKITREWRLCKLRMFHCFWIIDMHLLNLPEVKL
jgi:hypothetical protein